MDRQTLRDWVHPLNQHGLVGLIDIMRWRCVDLKRVVGQRFGVDVSEVSLGRRPEEAGLHTHQRPTTAPHPGSTGDRHIKKTFQRRS
jgi:hypothetical protein